jgi:hypothetical protein
VQNLPGKDRRKQSNRRGRCAFVAFELHFQVLLGVGCFFEVGQRDFEFATATRADCDHRNRSNPLRDSKIAFLHKGAECFTA